MKKNIIKILLILVLILNIGGISVNAEESSQKYGTTNAATNKYDQKINSDIKKTGTEVSNNHLSEFENGGKEKGFIKAGETGERGIYNTLLSVANILRTIFLALATVYFLITVLKLLFAEGSSEEEWEKFKKGFKWISVGIIVMQVAYSYVNVIFNKKIGTEIAGSITATIVEPLVKLLETAAVFFFIGVMVFSFYKLVTAGGEEEKAKEGKKSVVFAIVGFVIIKFANWFVAATYSKTLCRVDGVNCVNEKKLSDGAQIIFTIINWLNGFVGIAVVLMIIYAGAQIIFSNGDDDKIKTAKKSILYIIIGIVILIMNYLILTFFFTPELTK